MCATSEKCECTPAGGLRPDFLTKSVGMQRKAMEAMQNAMDKAAHIQKLRVICASSQVAHAITILAIGLVCSSFYGRTTNACTTENVEGDSSLLIRFVYIICISLHAGAQVWMTFVSGLSLYFNLPRHIFGDVQRVLFPRYFTVNSGLSGIALYTFVNLIKHLNWTQTHYVQVCALAMCFLLEVTARIYVAPRVLECMTAVRAIESKVEGVGQEVGRHCAGALAKCPEYVRAYQAFRRNHAMMAMANVMSMACTVTHIFYLANFIHFA